MNTGVPYPFRPYLNKSEYICIRNGQKRLMYQALLSVSTNTKSYVARLAGKYLSEGFTIVPRAPRLSAHCPPLVYKPLIYLSKSSALDCGKLKLKIPEGISTRLLVITRAAHNPEQKTHE